MTFPLPLTPFEEYILRDGTPSHPLDFFYRLSFDGPLDQAAVAIAAAEAFRRHPLLAARVEQHAGLVPRFTAGRVPTVTTLASQGEDDLPPLPALEPATGPLARLVAIERSNGTVDVLAQFHHVACDGLGALAFLTDFCVILDATLRGEPPAAPPPDPRGLRSRGRYGLDSWKLLRSLPAQARGLEGVWKFLRHRPVRLTHDGSEADAPCAGQLQRAEATFTSGEARGLRKAAAAAGVSLNELAAAALFEALREALPAAAFAHARDVVRLSIPMNMRRPADRRLPAANVVSMVFLDRGPIEIASGGLAASLHAEMQLIKRLGLGMTFLFTVAVARRLPGGIARLVADRSTAATALFTNLGRILTRPADRRGGLVKVGPRTLVAIEPIAPLRRGTAVAVAAAEYGGRLTFLFRSDPLCLDVAATAALRDVFADRLRCRLDATPESASRGASAVAVEAYA